MRAYSSFQSAFYFFLLCPDLSSWAINVEPPFASKTLEEIHKLNNLPSLIDPNQLIRGIDPAVFKALLDTNGNTKNSQPNPIARSFPQSATGTINSTTAVIPIDFAVARTIIPKQYAILKNSIYQTLPCFPKDKYPVSSTIQSFKLPNAYELSTSS